MNNFYLAEILSLTLEWGILEKITFPFHIMNKSLSLSIETLTPIWTAGVGGKVDRIHETGLMGSLRWWYEAMVRGVGGNVCNPTSDKSNERCPTIDKKGTSHYCDVCEIFGATGLKRKFGLYIDFEKNGEYLFDKTKIITVTAPNGRNGWRFGASKISSQESPVEGKIQIYAEHEKVANHLAILFKIIELHGGLGAKNQLGFGVVNLNLSENEKTIEANLEKFENDFQNKNHTYGTLPDLKNMFFAKLYFQQDIPDGWWENARLASNPKNLDGFRLKQGFSVPIAPAIKYKLRYGKNGESLLNSLSNTKKANSFFGYTNKSGKQRCMLNISNAYKKDGKWQFRLWGWIPEENDSQINRAQLVKEIETLVKTDISFWDNIFGNKNVDITQTEWLEVNNVKQFLSTLL